MTQVSRFWDGTTTGDATTAPYDAGTEFSKVLMSVAGAAGIATNLSGVFRGELSQLAVSGAATPVSIASGRAITWGTWFENDAATTVAIPTPASSTRVDRIVLRKDWVAQTVRVTRIAGVEGAGAPALTQVAGTTWDEPLAQVSITTGGVITLTDQREFIGGAGMPTPTGTNSILTSTGGVASWSTTPTIGGIVTVSLANANGAIHIDATTGANAASLRFSNTGGFGYVGLDDSTASIFGGSPFGLSLFAPGSSNIELVPGGSPSSRVTISSVGVVTIRGSTTMTTGSLRVSTGSVVVGNTAPSANQLIWAAGNIISDGSVGGYLVSTRNAVITAFVNADALAGIAIQHSFGLASKTGVACYGIDISPSWVAAGTNIGIRVNAVTSASSNYGIFINNPTGGSVNIGLQNNGTTALALNTGIGSNGVLTTAGLSISGTGLLAGATEYGIFVNTTVATGAITEYDVHYGNIVTPNSASTMTTGNVFFAEIPILGTSYTVTNIAGFRAANQGVSGKTTNAYGIIIVGQSGAATLNIGAHISGSGSATAGHFTLFVNGGDVVLAGTGSALATTATIGFTWLPSCAGPPTGVPTNTVVGSMPVIIDNSNLRIYVRISGTWRFAQLV